MQRLLITLSTLFFTLQSFCQVVDASQQGVIPNIKENMSIKLSQLIDKLGKSGKKATIVLQKGTYHFYPAQQNERTYYISNHDQVNPKQVGIVMENLANITLQGNGSDFIFHDRMLPMSIVDCKNITIRGISIDFAKPHIAQAEVIENNKEHKTITFKFADYVDFKVTDSLLYSTGKNWENLLMIAIAFEKNTKRLVYNSSDIYFGKRHCTINSDSTITAKWEDDKLIAGTVLAFRSWYRPAPAIFLSKSKNTKIENTTVHYAEGMGLLAQMSENIELNNFNVRLKGQNDSRYFTTQADATHFSGCKGKIVSNFGTYEGMMDDAINVHGTYLKIVKKIDSKTVIGRYMHSQAWGFVWGYKGDKVQFVASKTMEITGKQNTISEIKPYDKESVDGAKEFVISFKRDLDETITPESSIGIENLTWMPSINFENNLIRNNRARGSLFSTPKKTMIKGNWFDHTSGTAILLCGDCNGWFETGACKDVTIKQNLFINSLTSMFQFTNAVISIYPEIPNLSQQTKFFHKGVKIERNKFITFDKPILYAKSITNLTFKRNVIETNNDYPAYHEIKSTFLFEKSDKIKIKKNKFDFDFQTDKEIIFK